MSDRMTAPSSSPQATTPCAVPVPLIPAWLRRLALTGPLPVCVAGRHVRPEGMGARGRCHEQGRVLGQRDLRADPRRLKRLAHRLEAGARLGLWPRCLWVSPLRRCAGVGPWLRARGWQLRRDPRLMELDFGHWDGQAWSALPLAELQAWTDDFMGHACGGGESLSCLVARVGEWQSATGWARGPGADSWAAAPVLAHAGVLQVLAGWLEGQRTWQASQWGASTPYGGWWRAPDLRSVSE